MCDKSTFILFGSHAIGLTTMFDHAGERDQRTARNIIKCHLVSCHTSSCRPQPRRLIEWYVVGK